MMGRLADEGKRSEWVERLRRREKSGLMVAEFCEWEGVSVAAFYHWQKKLRGTTSSRRSAERVTPELKSQRPLQRASFLPVHMMQTRDATWQSSCIEIRLTNGVRLFVPNSDANALQKTIAAASRVSPPDGTVINQNGDPVEDATC